MAIARKNQKVFGPRHMISIAFSLLLFWAVWHEWPRVYSSLELLKNQMDGRLMLALPLVLLSILAAALAYRSLALRPLRLSELYCIELAAGVVNRVLPSGLGSLGVHVLYLHRRGHSAAQAATVAGINNLLGGMLHAALLMVLLVFDRSILHDFHLGAPKYMGWILLGIGLLLSVVIVSRAIRQRVFRMITEAIATLRQYRSRPVVLTTAGLSLAGVTACNLAIFALATVCLGVSLGIGVLFVVYTAGVMVGAAVPTPGGLGGVEAGLLGGLLAAGAPTEPALAAVLAFRLATFWIPLLIGIPALMYARSRQLL